MAPHLRGQASGCCGGARRRGGRAVGDVMVHKHEMNSYEAGVNPLTDGLDAHVQVLDLAVGLKLIEQLSSQPVVAEDLDRQALVHGGELGHVMDMHDLQDEDVQCVDFGLRGRVRQSAHELIRDVLLGVVPAEGEDGYTGEVQNDST